MDKSVIQEAREALSTLESEAHGLGMRSEYRHQLAACIRAGLNAADGTTPTPATTAQPAQQGSVPEGLRRVLTAAICLAHDRRGDVSDEDGSYATAPVDHMIELETALCEFFDIGSDDVVAHQMVPKMESLLSPTPQPEGDGNV